MATVTELIDAQSTSIDEVMTQADVFLNKLLDVTNIELNPGTRTVHTPVYPQTITFTPQVVAVPPVLANAGTPPSASIDVVVAPEPTAIPAFDTAAPVPVVPEAPSSTGLPTLTGVESFTTASPFLNTITVPSAILPDAPGNAPDFNPAVVPLAPTLDLPTAPEFAAIAAVMVPSIATIPTFDGVLPDLSAVITPTAQFSFYEAAYDSVLLDPLKTKLLADLTDGGYGIDTNDEVALFNRARDREIEVMMSKIEDAGRAMAMRGFPLPPGELSLYVDRAYQDMQDKVSGVSRDITLERSKLFVENRQFTIREVKEVEQILIGFHNSVQERALNVSRYTVELAVAIFNALVSRYNAQLDTYKSQAAVFAEQIRAQLTQVELYKAQVEATGIEAGVQRTQVEIYNGQLRGIEAQAGIYRTEMEGARARTEVERLRLEAFRTQVETYVARVQAKTAEFGMYRAQTDGERAKIELFESQVRAYNGQVTAAKVEADAKLGLLQSQVESVKAQASVAQAQASVYESQVRAFAAQVSAAKNEIDAKLGETQANAEAARIQLAVHQGNVAAFEAGVRANIGVGQVNIEGTRVAGENARLTNSTQVALADLSGKNVQAAWRHNIDSLNAVIESDKNELLARIESLKARIAGTEFASTKYFALLTALTSTINTLAVQTSTE